MSTSQSSLRFPIRKSCRTTRTVRKLFYTDDATTTAPTPEPDRSTRQSRSAKTAEGRVKTARGRIRAADKSVRIPFSPIEPDSRNRVVTNLDIFTTPAKTPIRKLNFSAGELTPTTSHPTYPEKIGSPSRRPLRQSKISSQFTPTKRGSPVKVVHTVGPTAPPSPRKPARDYGRYT